MALLRSNTWVAAGLVARLLMIAVLAMSVKFKYANHTRLDYSDRHNYNQLQSYSYAVATAFIGMVTNALQLPVSAYLLCKSKRTTASVLVLDVSMYTDVVVTAVLASGVGAGFGATNDVLEFINHGLDSWTNEENDPKGDLTSFFHRGSVAIVFLLVGMVLSVLATVVSTRIRTRASDDLADD